MKSVFARGRALAAVGSLLLLNCGVFAAEPALMQGNGVAVTPVDIQAEALRIPVEQRKRALSEPKNVQQAASNLFIRRSLALQAQLEGLDKDPVTVAALHIARERVLSDAKLAKMDSVSQPDDAAIEAYAQNMYKAEPKRFERPDEVSVRHILISKDTEGAEAKANKILADLKAGADFAELAKSQSQDPGSAAKGGELGYLPKGRTVPEFEAAAFALKKAGDLSGVVKTQFGYHILRLEDRRSAGKAPFAEVREPLRREAVARILAERRATAVQRLVDAAKIDEDAIKAFSASQH
jgi:peptidyl-prolyl cis-trans isomerase C